MGFASGAATQLYVYLDPPAVGMAAKLADCLLCTRQYDAAESPLYTNLQAGFPADHNAL